MLVVEFKYILMVWKLFCDVQKRRYGRGVVADAKRRGANGSVRGFLIRCLSNDRLVLYKGV